MERETDRQIKRQTEMYLTDGKPHKGNVCWPEVTVEEICTRCLTAFLNPESLGYIHAHVCALE